MYYSAGTYESFAHPEKPKDVDKKSAYIIGTGLAGLTAAFYLVRDGQMKGEHIHLLEKFELAGGSCDGRKDVTKGFFMRGGREMDNHFEVMWDTFRDVPSIETPGVSVLDEYYWLNKHDPNYSLCRATVNRGEDAHTDRKFELDKDSALALSKLFLTPEKDLEDKKISDVLPDSFWSTNFWLYWQTMFAFQRWSSALEMKRYLCRYVHHIDGLPDFSALRFTKYNQYESMILPLVKYLESHGVHIEYGMDVKNVIIETEGNKKVARQIVYVKDGKEQTIDLIEDDLVFITNGCCTDTSCYGDQTHAPDLSQVKAFLVVTVGDKTYQPIPLTEEGYYRLRHGDCINIVHVTPTSIDMHEANCDNQDCVEQGEVTLENKDTRILGNMIICLPNQVTLQLYSRDELMDWLTTVQEDAANE